METVRRNFRKILAGGRRQTPEEEYNDYAMSPPRNDKKNHSKVVPASFFPVCVAPEKQRFMITAEHLTHPRFWPMLGEDEEYEKSVQNCGPLWLPSADVDVFRQILVEIEASLSQSSLPEPEHRHRWGRRRLSNILRALKFRISNRQLVDNMSV